MSVRLLLECSGCDAKAEGTGRLRRKFVSFSGRDHGFGYWVVQDPEELTPEGWVMFDPYTNATYCPTCWAEIEAPTVPASVEESGQ